MTCGETKKRKKIAYLSVFGIKPYFMSLLKENIT